MELVLASGNPHKKEELEEILAPHSILLPADLGIDFDFPETGKTYYENSIGKAKHLYELCKRPVIADDSGLSVYALDGAPGIYSARFGMETGNLSPTEQNDLLLKKLDGINDRRAFYVCNMTLILSEYREYSFQETLEGEISKFPEGDGGFGYDPIFFLPDVNKTVAQITAAEKHTISHRGKAAGLLKNILDALEK